MARLQVLELPSGVDDERAPFVLVVDETMPDRVIIGFDGSRPVDRWGALAEQIGARGVVVTPETVAIPANELLPSDSFELVGDQSARVSTAEAKLKAFAEEHYRLDAERMDAITDALGFDRLRDWDEIMSAIKTRQQVAADGEHVFGEPGYLDPQRCARCGLGRDSWMRQRDTRTCSTVRTDAESGHEFRPVGARDELACLRCGMPRIEWAVRRATPQCNAVRQGGE